RSNWNGRLFPLQLLSDLRQRGLAQCVQSAAHGLYDRHEDWCCVQENVFNWHMKYLGVARARSLATPLAIYVASSVVVLAGIAAGDAWRSAERGVEPDMLRALAGWDGGMYCEIADIGYTYRGPHQRASMAFFPAYPLLGRGLKALTGLRTESALAL